MMSDPYQNYYLYALQQQQQQALQSQTHAIPQPHSYPPPNGTSQFTSAPWHNNSMQQNQYNTYLMQYWAQYYAYMGAQNPYLQQQPMAHMVGSSTSSNVTPLPAQPVSSSMPMPKAPVIATPPPVPVHIPNKPMSTLEELIGSAAISNRAAKKASPKPIIPLSPARDHVSMTAAADSIIKEIQRSINITSNPVEEVKQETSTPVEKVIIGKNLKLEKRYFRLTSAARAEDVRPLHVLRKTLDLLKQKWAANADYNYICEQFKSMRQDLMVQHIKNEFTVTVYEIHARISLEKSDMKEFNQCQSQLSELYKIGIEGHRLEFVAYQILYMLYTQNNRHINILVSQLSSSDKEHLAIKHALDVKTALVQSDYYTFFQLYLITPNMGGYIIDQFIERERIKSLWTICRGYRYKVPTSFLAIQLGFERLGDFWQFLNSINIHQDPDNTEFNLKDISEIVANVYQKKCKLQERKGHIVIEAVQNAPNET